MTATIQDILAQDRAAKRIEAAERLIWAVNTARSPLTATNRAMNRVARLAERTGKGSYHWLESALLEHKHGLLRQRLEYGSHTPAERERHAKAARGHFASRDVQFDRFALAAKREFT